MTRHLDLLQQLAGTDGHCHLWALALREVLGEAEIVGLYGTDRRTLEAHDHPLSIPLLLHEFARLPDGSFADAQGLHTTVEMCRKFGIKRGYSYRIAALPDDDDRNLEVLAETMPAWYEAILRRVEVLRVLGWDRDVPKYDGALELDWKRIRRLAQEKGIPEPEPTDYEAVHARPL